MNPEIIKEMRADAKRCREQKERNGSMRLYSEMIAKYSAIIPDFQNNTSIIGKAVAVGTEFDYRNELNAVAAKLEMLALSNSVVEQTLTGADPKLDDAFISYAAEVLADTEKGLTGRQIIQYCNSYAIDFTVKIPITDPDFGRFGSTIPNKRTALHRNLMAFNALQQFTIIKELCELPIFEGNTDVAEVKKRLFNRYSEYSSSDTLIDDYSPTGWDRVDRVVEEMKERLKSADTEEKYQTIGMLGRETLITIAQQVYDSSKHKVIDGVQVSTNDSKRMLEAFINTEMKNCSDKAIKFARAAVDLANQLTHDRNATKREAELCLIAVASVGAVAKALIE